MTDRQTDRVREKEKIYRDRQTDRQTEGERKKEKKIYREKVKEVQSDSVEIKSIIFSFIHFKKEASFLVLGISLYSRMLFHVYIYIQLYTYVSGTNVQMKPQLIICPLLFNKFSKMTNWFRS